MSKTEEFEKAINPELESLGYELVDLQYEAKAKLIRVFIDFLSSDQKIGLEDCVRVDRALGEMIEGSETFPEEITLEVSSPGVNRVLRKDSDFKRFAGNRVKVKTFAPIDIEDGSGKKRSQKSFIGELKGFDEASENILLDVDGYTIQIPRKSVSKANIEFDFSELD